MVLVRRLAAAPVAAGAVAFVAFVTLVVVAGAAPVARADDPPKPPALPARAAVLAYERAVSASNRGRIDAGGLRVEVQVIPDYVAWLVAREYLTLEAQAGVNEDFVREKIKRLVKKHAALRGRPLVRVRLVAEGASADNLFLLEGGIQTALAMGTDRGRVKTTVVGQEGVLPTRQFTLFKAARSGLFAGQAQPVMRVSYTIVEDPFAIDIVLKDAPDAKATRLDVAFGSVLRITDSGNGISGNQIDFENGASGRREPGGKTSFDLPLIGPKLPDGLAALLEG